MIRDRGITLIELLVVMAIIGVIAAIAAPQLGLFRSSSNLRNCATDLIQYMRVAQAMAIKENREYLIVFDTAGQRYLIGFDGDVPADNNLTTLNSDTFGICKDTVIPLDRLPDNDILVNGVPACVRVVNLSDCGNNIIFGYTSGTTPPNGPNGIVIPLPSGISFGSIPPSADFNADGSAGRIGAVYFQQTTRGYSYCVIVSNNTGATNMWKWDGDADNPGITTWTEMR
jgi:prepilin-type N-terminal cleavage/methylation domain-containing protein